AARRGEPAGPTIEDGAVRLGDEVGPDAAGRAIDALAAREIAPLQVGADPGSPERLRAGAIVAHVVTAGEEAAYLPVLRRVRRADARTGAALSLLTAAAAVAGPPGAIRPGRVGAGAPPP